MVEEDFKQDGAADFEDLLQRGGGFTGMMEEIGIGTDTQHQGSESGILFGHRFFQQRAAIGAGGIRVRPCGGEGRNGVGPTVPQGKLNGGFAGGIGSARVRAQLDEGLHEIAPSGIHGDMKERVALPILEVRVRVAAHHRRHEVEAAMANHPRQDFLAIRHQAIGAGTGP